MASLNTEPIPSDGIKLSASLLPRSFALKSVVNSKYMRCRIEGDAGGLVFSVEAILWEPSTQYEVELTSTEGIVHIRSTFNNKYLRKDSESSQWVKALATEKSEHTSRWDCTMFEVLPATEVAGQIRLRHVQLGYSLSMISEGLGTTTTTPTDGSDHFTFFNWSTLVIMPRYVAFKGPNGRYLRTGDDTFLGFNCDDKGEVGVTMELVPVSDGNVYIKEGPGQFSSYWMKNSGIDQVLIAFTTEGEGWELSPFQVNKDADDLISFKHLASNMFCRSGNFAGFPDRYMADTRSMTKDTKLLMEEAVIRRTVDIEWRLDDARVYNVVPVELTGSTHDNYSSTPVSKDITLAYQTEVTSSFESSNTWSVGISVSIETPSIPFIGGADIEMSAEYGGTYTWGESKTTTSSFSETDTYTVHPRNRLVVKKLSTKGSCDVPYKYVQTDYLFNGDTITTNKEDGVYKGVNYFNIYTSNSDEPIPESLWVD